jgi:POT family proton-dependent oligopeptide transporter
MLGSSLVLMLCERYGYSRADALRLAGIVNAATYLGTLPGGIASDRAGHPARWLGASMGLLAVGYAALVLTAPAALWLALALLLVGHALFKPNTQAAIASQYPVGDSRLDAAQILFYIAVNGGGPPNSSHWLVCRF